MVEESAHNDQVTGTQEQSAGQMPAPIAPLPLDSSGMRTIDRIEDEDNTSEHVDPATIDTAADHPDRPKVDTSTLYPEEKKVEGSEIFQNPGEKRPEIVTRKEAEQIIEVDIAGVCVGWAVILSALAAAAVSIWLIAFTGMLMVIVSVVVLAASVLLGIGISRRWGWARHAYLIAAVLFVVFALGSAYDYAGIRAVNAHETKAFAAQEAQYETGYWRNTKFTNTKRERMINQVLIQQKTYPQYATQLNILLIPSALVFVVTMVAAIFLKRSFVAKQFDH
jgi:hypothetical protein